MTLFNSTHLSAKSRLLSLIAPVALIIAIFSMGLIYLRYDLAPNSEINILTLIYIVSSIYFLHQLFSQLTAKIPITSEVLKVVLEFAKFYLSIFISHFIQFYVVGHLILQKFYDPNWTFMLLAFGIPSLGLSLLIYAMKEARTKHHVHRLILLLLSGAGSVITLLLIHLLYQHTSLYTIGFLTYSQNVITIYFLYQVFSYAEGLIENAIFKNFGKKTKGRGFRFFIEFIKLFLAIFLSNYIQYYLISRPIFNQTYDTNFFLIVITFSIPSAAIARIIFELRQAQELALQSRLAQAEAQYNLLEAQMQPHFLFNSLNVLSELIYVDPDLACSVTQQLADLYREILTNSKQNFSNLKSEISILKKYIQIQKIRFGDRIRFKCDVDPAFDNISVPSLILQTLVENAIKHGISPRQEGGDIELTVTPIEPEKPGSPLMYEISVSNTGELYKGPKTKELGTGLQNTKNRLELFYGHSHGFNIYSDSNKTYVKFRVPQQRELQETTL